MTLPVSNGLNLQQAAIINALLHPVAADPTSPQDGQVWFNTSTNRLMVRANAANQSVAWLSDIAAGAISGTLWDEHTIVAAVADNNPVPVTIGEDTLVGRLAGGNIGPVNPAQILALLGVEAGATGDQTLGELVALGLASETYADNAASAAVAAIVDTSPAALDTLNEIAAALGDDANFAATVNASIAQRAQIFASDIGDGTATVIPVVHSLNTLDVITELYDKATGQTHLGDPVRTNANTVTFSFATAPTTNQLRAVIAGRP